MVHVAKEMTRQGFTLPLLIGGANVHAFVGVGPYFVDSDGDGVIEDTDTRRAAPGSRGFNRRSQIRLQRFTPCS